MKRFFRALAFGAALVASFLPSIAPAEGILSSPTIGKPASQGLFTFGTGGDPIVAQLPAGALGIYIADTYKTTPRPYLPNLVSAIAPSTTVAPPPRRWFNATLWTPTSLTVVDKAVVGPDGLTEASTIVGVGFFHPALGALPAGTYTGCISVKSNTGSSQTFKQAFYNWSITQSPTATTSWQRFCMTGTSSGDPFFVPVASPDSTSGGVGTVSVNLQIADAALYPGSVDLGAETLAGHLYLGRGNATAANLPTYASGALDMSSSGMGLLQFGNNPSFSRATVIGVLSKVVNAAGLQAYVDSQDDVGLVGYAENGAPDFSFQGHMGIPAAQSNINFWQFYNKGWYMLTERYDGTAQTISLDNVTTVFTKTVARSPISLQDFKVGAGNAIGSFNKQKMAALVIYNRSLSDAEVRQAYVALMARVATNGITPYAKRIYVAEGDSITYGYPSLPAPYPILFGANASPVVYGRDQAVIGDQISNLAARAPALDAMLPPAGQQTGTYILSVLVGFNDLNAGGHSPATVLTDLAAYLDARRAAGWKTVCVTLLPSTVAGINASRNTVNAAITGGWLGVHCDKIADFGADATMGPDAAASDTSIYADGIHPTALGHVDLEPVLRAQINAIP